MIDNLVCSWINFGPRSSPCGVTEPVLRCQVSGEGIYYHRDLDSMTFLPDLETFLGNHLAPAAEREGAQGCWKLVQTRKICILPRCVKELYRVPEFSCWRASWKRTDSIHSCLGKNRAHPFQTGEYLSLVWKARRLENVLKFPWKHDFVVLEKGSW